MTSGAPGVGALHQLAAGERATTPPTARARPRALPVDGQLGERAREEQVAGGGGREPAALGEHGRPPAPQRRAVEHVVVHERRHVQQLHGGRGRRPAARRRRRSRTGTPASGAAACRPPRASPSRAARSSAPWPAADLGQPRLGALEQARQLRAAGGQHRAELGLGRVHRLHAPAWMAMMPPAVSTQRTSSSPAATSRSASSRGPGEAAHARRQVGVGVGVAGQPAERGHHAVEPEPEEPRQRRLLRRRDLEDDHAAAGPRHAGHLAQPAVEVGEVARAEAHRRGVERRRPGRRARARCPARTRSPAPCAARQLEHALGEVEPDHLRPRAPAQLDRQVAGAGGHVERARAGADRAPGRPRAGASGGACPAVMTEFMRS